MFSIPILLLCEKLLPEKVSMYIFNVLIKVISIVFIVLLILTPIWNIKYKTVIDLKNNRLNTFEIYSPLYKFEDNTVNYDTTGPKSVFYYYMAQGVALKKYSNINSYIFNEIIENEDRVELAINCINNNDYIYCSDRDLEYRLNNYLSLKKELKSYYNESDYVYNKFNEIDNLYLNYLNKLNKNSNTEEYFLFSENLKDSCSYILSMFFTDNLTLLYDVYFYSIIYVFLYNSFLFLLLFSLFRKLK